MAIFKTSRHSLRWLLAELTVVILGILIAFQVDAWRSERSEAVRERQYLTDMLRDLENDVLSLESAIAQRQERLPAIRRLVVLLTDPATDQSFEQELIALEHRAVTGSVASFIPVTLTYEKMQQAGDLTTVRDPALYQTIVEYYQFLDRGLENTGVSAWLAPWRQLSLELYGPLRFIQSWDENGTSAAVADRYRSPDEERVTPSFDVAARRNHRAYMSFLGDIYQGQAYWEVVWTRYLARNRNLQASIRDYLETSS